MEHAPAPIENTDTLLELELETYTIARGRKQPPVIPGGKVRAPHLRFCPIQQGRDA
jgi:hypothetical protein